MKIPMKVDYGVRALVDLARHYGGSPVQTAEIAARQRIPEAYLDQLMTTLHKFGFVRSRRGPQGGHVLARPPEEVTVDSVVRALEGDTPLVECLSGSSECMHLEVCAQQEVWRGVEEAMRGVLRSTTIADLWRREAALSARGTYQI